MRIGSGSRAEVDCRSLRMLLMTEILTDDSKATREDASIDPTLRTPDYY